MRLHDLLAGSEIDLEVFEVRGERDIDVLSITHDSRDVTPGALFCCIPGEHTDGHVHAPAAVDAGAVACVVEHDVTVAVPQVWVRSVRRAIGPLCARFFAYPSRGLRVLGVTGTNGKTTTTYLLEAIARANGETVGVIGTVGARLEGASLPLRHTTPEATDLQALLARMRDGGAQTVAMEVSSHALDQHRVDGTYFDAACFTNLSHDHLDYHGSLDAYFDAKARLFTPEFTAHAVVGTDDANGSNLAARTRDVGLTTTTYGIDGDADVTASEVMLAGDHSRFVVHLGPEAIEIRSPLVGRFNVLNALAAGATAYAVGVSPAVIGAGLSAPVVVPGRMERVDAGQDFTVLVDYAHTPDALQSVLDAARPLVANGGRLIVVFGCGGDRDRAKRPLMGAVATRLADHAIITSDNPRSEDPATIAEEIRRGASNETVIELDRRSAIRSAVRAANTGDVVVIAGKGHEPGQTTAGVTLPFDDRMVAREEVKARS